MKDLLQKAVEFLLTPPGKLACAALLFVVAQQTKNLGKIKAWLAADPLRTKFFVTALGLVPFTAYTASGSPLDDHASDRRARCDGTSFGEERREDSARRHHRKAKASPTQVLNLSHTRPHCEDVPQEKGGRMKWLFLLLLALAAAIGCGPRVEALTADAVADAVNAAKPLILSAYERQANEQVSAATSVEDGKLRLDRLDEQWRPIREAHEALRQAHTAWVASIEAGDNSDIGRVRTAYCVLAGAARSRVALPDWPGGGCSP